MPTYEYRCNACKREFEYQQKMSDDDLVTCEVCGEPKLEKLISWSAFQLKGGGWYKDLYASQTPAQQREVAKDAVDKGAPPKGDSTAAKAEHNAKIDAAAPAAPAAPAAGSSSSSSGGGGGDGGGSSGGGGGSAAKE